MSHIQFMREALNEAKLAERNQEVPIGAVITQSGKIIARSHNKTIQNNDPTAHAEIAVIREAAKNLNNHRLNHTALYITLEPCLMCYGAIIQARIPEVYFGAYDKRTGVFSQPNLSNLLSLNHHPKWDGGILETECSNILQIFFKTKR